MDLSYFVVTCEETDLFDGKIVRVNKKARDIDEVCLILKTYFNTLRHTGKCIRAMFKYSSAQGVDGFFQKKNDGS